MAAPTIESLRTQFCEAYTRARSLESEYAASDEPTSEHRAALDQAIATAEGLNTQLTELQTRSERFAALQARAQAPGDRLGSPLLPHTDGGNTRGRHEYSLIRAVQGELLQREGRGALAGLESEVHQELVKMRGGKSRGIMVPLDAPIQQRSLTTVTGSGAIPNIVRPTMIDVLRARLVLAGLGATIISDMHQPFSLPKTTNAVFGAWVATEGVPNAAQTPDIGQVSFSWKSVEARTILSRQFIMNASIQAENYIVDQLTKGVANPVEAGALTGTGTGGAPKGLFTYTSADGVGVHALGTNGGAATWADVLALKALVSTANAPDANRAWLFNPDVVSYLQGAPKVAGYPRFILDSDDKIASYPYASSSLVPNNLTKGTSVGVCSAMAFGAWSELAIALFSGIDLFIDPYSSKPHVDVTMVQDVDVNFLHLASFANSLDLLTA